MPVDMARGRWEHSSRASERLWDPCAHAGGFFLPCEAHSLPFTVSEKPVMEGQATHILQHPQKQVQTLAGMAGTMSTPASAWSQHRHRLAMVLRGVP